MNPSTRLSPNPYAFSKGKTLVYAILPALILLGSVEGCARLFEFWRPPFTLDYGWGFNEDSRVFAPAGFPRGQMATRPEKAVSFESQRFQMPKPEGVYRIIALGGSNVYYMRRNLTMMAQRLTRTPGETRRFEVINAGGCAYGSHRLRIVLREMLSYEPDLIMIYAGHNEFEELLHEELVDLKAIPVQKAAYSLACLRLARDLGASLRLLLLDPKTLRQTQPPEVNWGAAAAHEFSAEEIDERMRLFRENMKALIEQCIAENLPVVISTVAGNYWAPGLHYRHADEGERIQQLYREGKHAEGLSLARDLLARTVRHQASDVENGIIRELAREHSLPLIDGEQLIMEAEPHGVPGETLLSDNCHLTHEGREIVIRAFEALIRRIAAASGDQDAREDDQESKT